MAILDSKGRLFGKVSVLDIGAGLIILMAVAGLLFGNSAAQDFDRFEQYFQV